MVEVDRVDAQPVHLPVALADQAVALPAQEGEIARGDHAVEDEEAVVGEAAGELGGLYGLDRHVLLSLSGTHTGSPAAPRSSSHGSTSSYRFL